MQKVVATVLALSLGMLGLWLLDGSARSPRARLEPRGAPPSGSLYVFMVDSWDARDFTRERMPKLWARSQQSGLRGPVEACIDAVTVPCVSAMVAGYDRSSLFAFARNFGAAESLVQASVLGALQARGRKVGYFGEPLLASALGGLTHVETPEGDEARIAAALRARTRFDLRFVHLLTLDEAAHKSSAEGSAYAEALRWTDDRLEQVLASLSPDDHVAIVGDHGHAPSGRHITGVGVESYALYFGPRFRRAEERRMAITDHARIWPELLGFAFVEERSARSSAPRLALVVLLALLLALSPLLLRRRVRTLWAGVQTLVRERDPLSLLLATSLLLAPACLSPWPPVNVAIVSVVVVLLIQAGRALARRAHGPLAMLVLPVGLLLSLLPVQIERFVAVSFPLYRAAAGTLGAWLPALLWLLALAHSGRRVALVSGALGCALVPLLERLHNDVAFAAPCAFAFPAALVSLCLPSLFALTCAAVPSALWFLYGGDAAQLGALAATFSLWATLPVALARTEPLTRASALLFLIWLSFWTAMGTRAGGVDFDFFFRWLPGEAGATSALVPQSLLTSAKCLLPGVFGVCLAQARGSLSRAQFEGAESLARMRLGIALLYAAGYALAPGASVAARGDTMQEAGFWLLALSVTGLYSVGQLTASRQRASSI